MDGNKESSPQSLFLRFVQVIIGTRECMGHTPDDAEWRHLYTQCKRHSLLGVGFAGVEQCHGKGEKCPLALRHKWMAQALRIKACNHRLNMLCAELDGLLTSGGLACCVLKGQSHMACYPQRLAAYRQAGDIDMYVALEKRGFGGGKCYVHDVESILKRLARTGLVVTKTLYHHAVTSPYKGVELELHYRPLFFHSPLRNRRMQAWFRRHAAECLANRTAAGFAVPAASVNVIYIMSHLYLHHLESGLGMRQLMDFYYVLKAWRAEGGRDAATVADTIDWLGMTAFSGALAWVLCRVFDMQECQCVSRPDAHRGRRLLESVLACGNFGQADTHMSGMRHGGWLRHGMWKLHRVATLAGDYPEEALSEPLFRVFHLLWRTVMGIRNGSFSLPKGRQKTG